jgi:hypothetical protein
VTSRYELLSKCDSGNQNKENETGGECDMYRREERCRKGFGREITREKGKRPLRKPRYGWEINMKLDLYVGREGVDWIDLAQDMAMWLALVNMAINLRIS